MDLLETYFLSRVFNLPGDRVANVKLAVARICSTVSKEREYKIRHIRAIPAALG
jgi:hypothetical protein